MTTGRWSVRIVAGVIVVLTLLVYGNSLSGSLVLDDELTVVHNPSLRHLGAIGTVLSPPTNSPLGGRPVANLSFALNFAFAGPEVRSYRAVNVALHAATALLLFGVVRRTLGRVTGSSRPMSDHAVGGDRENVLWSGAIAAIWAVHPITTNAVAYLSQRTEQLMALFYLLTIYAFVRGVESRRGVGWGMISVAACALGMGSKEVMVTAPLLVLLYDRTFVAGSLAAAWRRHWRYYLGLGATWLGLAFLMSGGLSQRAVGYGLGVGWLRYALTECEAVLVYLRLALWPTPLVFDYGPVFADGLHSSWPAVLAVAVALGVVILWSGRRPTTGFLAAGFFIVLAPTSSVVPIATQPIAESRMYLPLMFAVTLGVVIMSRWVGRLGLPVLAAIVLGFGIQTSRRNEIMRDSLELWRDTVSKRPENPRARSLYGAALFLRGRMDEAIVQQREALRLDPSMARAHANLAAALAQKGRDAEALDHARRAAQLAPDLPEAFYEAGNALMRLGQADEAVAAYRTAIRIRPEYAHAHSNLGAALYVLGKPEEAIGCFERALQLKPDLDDARQNLAAALARTSRAVAAIDLYRAILRVRPEAANVHYDLGLVLAGSGRFDEAAAEFHEAIRLRPEFQPAQIELERLRRNRAQTETAR